MEFGKTECIYIAGAVFIFDVSIELIFSVMFCPFRGNLFVANK